VGQAAGAMRGAAGSGDENLAHGVASGRRRHDAPFDHAYPTDKAQSLTPSIINKTKITTLRWR